MKVPFPVTVLGGIVAIIAAVAAFFVSAQFRQGSGVVSVSDLSVPRVIELKGTLGRQVTSVNLEIDGNVSLGGALHTIQDGAPYKTVLLKGPIRLSITHDWYRPEMTLLFIPDNPATRGNLTIKYRL